MADPSWYFTSPWEPVALRRGDALGLRAGADYFAELLAPGLNNGSSDARWISILAWCLRWSQLAWAKAGGSDLSQRDSQRARYAWLRPLELLWVDRALEAGRTSGQLRGRQSVARWRNGQRAASNFGMSPEQFRRYRQVGTYGAYRVVFRSLPGLTVGDDGWTPDGTSRKLADFIDAQLPSEAQLKAARLEERRTWPKWVGKEALFWTSRGWPNALEHPRRGPLPTADDAVAKKLPRDERKLLAPRLFDSASARTATARALASAAGAGATTHAEVCDALAADAALAKLLSGRSLAPLPAFTRLADAAMHALRGVWHAMHRDGSKHTLSATELVRAGDLSQRLDVARQRGEDWLVSPVKEAFPHHGVATALATALREGAPVDRLRALVRHHREHGGGRRWLEERPDGKLVPLVPDTGIGASDYRFRLRALARLAGQCGQDDMTRVLDALDRTELEPSAAPADDEDAA